MVRVFILAFVLAQGVMFSSISAAQSPDPAGKVAFEDLLASAQRGNATAQLELGRAYLGRAFQTGVTVQPNSAEALRWYLKAADQNNTDALFELGSGYEEGFFGAEDAAKAVQYYRRAAGLGDKRAAVSLTHLYIEGADGQPKNFDEAAHWANCPKPSTMTMQSCESVTREQLPKPALALLRKLKCNAGSNYDFGARIHLRTDSDSPYYEVCCHDAPHGPCDATLIGEIEGEWTDLTEIVGFETTCGGLMVLESAHSGLHDLCLPYECSPSDDSRCQPTVLEFNGTRYAFPASSASRPKRLP